MRGFIQRVPPLSSALSLIVKLPFPHYQDDFDIQFLTVCESTFILTYQVGVWVCDLVWAVEPEFPIHWARTLSLSYPPAPSPTQTLNTWILFLSPRDFSKIVLLVFKNKTSSVMMSLLLCCRRGYSEGMPQASTLVALTIGLFITHYRIPFMSEARLI